MSAVVRSAGAELTRMRTRGRVWVCGVLRVRSAAGDVLGEDELAELRGRVLEEDGLGLSACDLAAREVLRE